MAAFVATWRPDTAQARWSISTEALAAARRADDPIAEVTARTLCAVSAQETGRLPEMWQETHTARELARRLRLASHQVALGWLEIPWLALKGRLGDAERLFAATVALMERTSMGQRLESPAGTAVVLRMVCDQVDDQVVGEFRTLAAHSPLPLDATVLVLMLRADRLAEARAWYAVHGIGLEHDDWFSLWHLCMTAEAAAGLGLQDLAAAVYQRLLPFAGRPCCAGGTGALGPVDAYLALAAAAIGEREAAARHADAALALCEVWEIPLAADRVRAHQLEIG